MVLFSRFNLLEEVDYVCCILKMQSLFLGYWLNDVRRLRPSHRDIIGSFSKPQLRRQRERHQTKCLKSRTTILHLRFESWYISYPSSAKQERKMTKFYVFLRTGTAGANISYRTLELNAIAPYLA